MRQFVPSARAAVVAFLVLMLAATLGAAMAFAILWPKIDTNSGRIDTLDDVTDIVAEAIAVNCTADLKARVEYRERAIVEKRLVKLEARSNRLQSKSNRLIKEILAFSISEPRPGHTPEGVALAADSVGIFARISELQLRISQTERELHERITILPLRDCAQLRRDLVRLLGTELAEPDEEE